MVVHTQTDTVPDTLKAGLILDDHLPPEPFPAFAHRGETAEPDRYFITYTVEKYKGADRIDQFQDKKACKDPSVIHKKQI
jgi:hypothetical protein